MRRLLEDAPHALTRYLREHGLRRVCLVQLEADAPRLEASDPSLQPLADELARHPDFADHDAIFLEVGRESGALFGAFVHSTVRGQSQGGLRRWSYDRLLDFLADGLRLSRGMTRKSALAGLWWGGGKGIIAEAPSSGCSRAALYREYGQFVASLRGCYLTAEDVGTTPADIAEVYRQTRFVTCTPPELGGSGNPSRATAAGVICAMEAALDWLGTPNLEGQRIVMQGAGQVGSAMIEQLLEKGVESIRVAEVSEERRHILLDRFAAAAVEVVAVEPDDLHILAEPCDVLVPNALGGVLGPKTIPLVQASLICGAANNQLLDEARDGAALAERWIPFVPDVLCNRMGLVVCANEQYGDLPNDPAILRHLGRHWENSIFVMTQRILRAAEEAGISPVAVTDRLADELATHPHPIWHTRARAIIDSLVAQGWSQRAGV